jgi:glycosyltransferase involved in cell wall biosynthesis
MKSDYSVTHFIPHLSPSMGGITTSIEELVKNLRFHGISSQVISLGNSTRVMKHTQSLSQELNQSGVSTWQTRALISNPYAISFPFPVRKNVKGIAASNLIVIHQIYTMATIRGYLAAKREKVPLVIFPHGSLTRYHESDSSIIKHIAKKIVLNRILIHCEGVIVTCTQEQNDLPKYLRAKSRVIPYGVNIQQIPSTVNYDDDSHQIIFAGRFTKKKNLNLLLQALPEILKSYPSLILNVCGSGTRREVRLVHSLIRTLKLQESVKLHGWLSRKDLERLMPLNRFLVLPSENENFGLVTTEALSLGVPCIVSRDVGTADWISKRGAGTVIPSLTIQNLTDAVKISLAADPRQLRERAIQTILEDFSWKKVSDSWKVFISDLNENPPSK